MPCPNKNTNHHNLGTWRLDTANVSCSCELLGNFPLCKQPTIPPSFPKKRNRAGDIPKTWTVETFIYCKVDAFWDHICTWLTFFQVFVGSHLFSKLCLANTGYDMFNNFHWQSSDKKQSTSGLDQTQNACDISRLPAILIDRRYLEVYKY